MHKIQGPNARVMATNTVAIRAVVIVTVVVVGRPMVEPMPWIPMSSRGTRFVSLK